MRWFAAVSLGLLLSSLAFSDEPKLVKVSINGQESNWAQPTCSFSEGRYRINLTRERESLSISFGSLVAGVTFDSTGKWITSAREFEILYNDGNREFTSGSDSDSRCRLRFSDLTLQRDAARAFEISFQPCNGSSGSRNIEISIPKEHALICRFNQT